MTESSLNPQLKADTHELLCCDDFWVLLHRNKSLPWLIVVPKDQAVEWYDLPESLQLKTANLVRKLSLFLKQNHHCDKINTATIGNVVSQLHIHVIGRYYDDALWPDVVWGNAMPEAAYTEQELQAFQQTLKQALEVL